jgi:N-glycosylase/DNA lyase
VDVCRHTSDLKRHRFDRGMPMLQDLPLTLDVIIVCSTLLAALHMFKRSIERVARQKHSVFMLLLPFGITWMFAGGDRADEIEQLVKQALLKRSKVKALPHDEVVSLNPKNQRAQ